MKPAGKIAVQPRRFHPFHIATVGAAAPSQPPGTKRDRGSTGSGCDDACQDRAAVSRSAALAARPQMNRGHVPREMPYRRAIISCSWAMAGSCVFAAAQSSNLLNGRIRHKEADWFWQVSLVPAPSASNV